MKKYLERRIELLNSESDKYRKIIYDKNISQPQRSKTSINLISNNDTVMELEQALNFLNAQHESQNVSNNECEKEVCEACGTESDAGGRIFLCEHCIQEHPIAK